MVSDRKLLERAARAAKKVKKWRHERQANEKRLEQMRAKRDKRNERDKNGRPLVAVASVLPICRIDGRCQYAIDHGAEGLGACPEGKCAITRAAAELGKQQQA